MADKKTTTKKTVKTSEVKTIAQLNADLVAAVTDLTDSRRSHAQGELVNPHVLTTQRKEIARIKTAITAAAHEGKESK